MHQESADELAAGECHRFALLAVGVILVLKADLSVLEFQQSVIRNCDAMRIPGQIPKHLLTSPVDINSLITVPWADLCPKVDAASDTLVRRRIERHF